MSTNIVFTRPCQWPEPYYQVPVAGTFLGLWEWLNVSGRVGVDEWEWKWPYLKEFPSYLIHRDFQSSPGAGAPGHPPYQEPLSEPDDHSSSSMELPASSCRSGARCAGGGGRGTFRPGTKTSGTGDSTTAPKAAIALANSRPVGASARRSLGRGPPEVAAGRSLLRRRVGGLPGVPLGTRQNTSPIISRPHGTRSGSRNPYVKDRRNQA
ncbi:hypothetical protein VP1G_10914 [Cytospora mali]|uniref:Uncharacterized protein n=1 Tax=Cytospora mali TaxID=578113 RepID=A0A194V0T4_CYTMA|nr:hypothetical protein VP1G_10914 [Valsa mali var. pyri (nom. inval.)]